MINEKDKTQFYELGYFVTDVVLEPNRLQSMADEMDRLYREGVEEAKATGDPKVILADEPTGNLDPSASDDIIDLFEEESKEGMTVIMATHNYPLIEDRIQNFIELNNGKLVS